MCAINVNFHECGRGNIWWHKQWEMSACSYCLEVELLRITGVCVCVHMNMQAPVYKSWSGPLPLCPGTTSPILLPCYKLQSRWSRIIYVSSCLCLLFRSKSAGITDMHLHTWILFLTMGSRIEFRLSGNLLSLLSHLAEVEVTVESWVYSSSFCINRVVIGEADVQ